MDKAILSTADIENLLAWRDKNKELVRKNPCPLNAIEIICKDTNIKIKGIRGDGTLKLSVNVDGKSMGSVEFAEFVEGQWMSIPGRNKIALRQEDIQSALTVYCSFMALLTFYQPEIIEKDRPTRVGKVAQTKPRQTAKKREPITYIVRKIGKSLCAVPAGSHASPKGVFTVRGYYRHTKTGKLVWVRPYKKGEGKKKSRRYAIGNLGGNDEKQ